MSAPRVDFRRLGRLAGQHMAQDGRTPRAIGQATGVSRRDWIEIRAGRKIPALAYLRLCAYLGVDPVTLEPADEAMAESAAAGRCEGGISWALMAAGLAGRMLADGLTVAAAARAVGVSVATISRACRGETVDARSLLAISAFLGKHPHEMCERRMAPSGARFTGNAHCNALESNDTADTGDAA